MAERLDRLRYRVSQSMRVAWYGGHNALVRELARAVRRLEDTAPPAARANIRSAELNAAIADLFARDWENIAAGLYAMPNAGWNKTSRAVGDSLRFIRDMPRVYLRRRAQAHSEVRAKHNQPNLPAYYLQNFHYQTDGYLSEESARLYDFQVETLFAGTADAMRRQALVPLAHWLKGRDQRSVRLLDVAAGTGRFLRMVKENFPRVAVTALDLSAPYLAKAKRALVHWPAVQAIEAKAEAMPFADGTYDIVSCHYLFHELPPGVRRAVAGEMARVVRPGGLVVFLDSIQYGDVAGWDEMLKWFPAIYHEPYYGSYLETDIAALFGAGGLGVCHREIAFLSKVIAFKPEA